MNEATTVPIVMTLTKAQADVAAWALDPMGEYAESGDADYTPNDLPELRGVVLVLPNLGSVSDLLYRLEEQLPDMARAECVPEGARVALNLAAKIRAVTGYTGPVWMGHEDWMSR